MRVISIDIGTSRIKCALFDRDGNMLHLRSRALKRAASPDVQDALVWIETSAELLREMTAMDGYGADAVALTGNMHALLGVDREGKPLAPAVLWCDNSASAESANLNDRYGDSLLDRFGNVSTPVFTLPKILKMKAEQPELYGRTAKFLQSKDIVAHFLTGEFVTDPSDASGTLLMELESRKWSADMLDELEIDGGKMPDILPSAAICGTVTAAAAAVTGLKAGTPVITGCGDLASAALGSAVDEKTLSLTLGTAGQLLAAGGCGTWRKLAGRQFVFAHAEEGRELFLGSVPAGGFSFEWLAAMHGIAIEEFFNLALKPESNEGLPVFLPYLLGRGAPYMDYASDGGWFGLAASHGLPEICRGAILGVLSALRQSCDLLEELDGSRRRIVLQALACRQKAVRDCACSLFGQEKFISDNGEASLLGAAMLGMTALGAYPDVDSAKKGMWQGKCCDDAHISGTDVYYARYLKYADMTWSFSGRN